MISAKLIITLALIGAVFCAPAEETSDDGRILHGRKAAENAYPFQVSLQVVKTSFGMMTAGKFCGGVILNNNFVLSAAHCFDNMTTENLNIHAGTIHAYEYSSKSQLIPVKNIYEHPGWSVGKNDEDDIAILRLERPLKFGASVQPIALPPSDYEASGVGTIIGWGATTIDNKQSSPDLLVTELEVSPMKECVKLWKMTGQQICLGANSRQSACGGDSGGPFIQTVNGKRTVVGITSFGGEGCKEYEPVVYTKVAAYVDWINRILNY